MIDLGSYSVFLVLQQTILDALQLFDEHNAVFGSWICKFVRRCHVWLANNQLWQLHMYTSAINQRAWPIITHNDASFVFLSQLQQILPHTCEGGLQWRWAVKCSKPPLSHNARCNRWITTISWRTQNAELAAILAFVRWDKETAQSDTKAHRSHTFYTIDIDISVIIRVLSIINVISVLSTQYLYNQS